METLTLHWVWVGIKKLPTEYLINIRNIMNAAKLSGTEYQFNVNVKIWTDDPRLIVSTLAKEDCLFLLDCIDICDIHSLSANHDNAKIFNIIRQEMTGTFANFASASDILRLLILKEQTSSWHLYFDTDTEHSYIKSEKLFLSTLKNLNDYSGIYTSLNINGNGGNDILLINASNTAVRNFFNECLNQIIKYYDPKYKEDLSQGMFYDVTLDAGFFHLITLKRFASKITCFFTINSRINSRTFLTKAITGPDFLYDMLFLTKDNFNQTCRAGFIATPVPTGITTHRANPVIGMSIYSGCANTWLRKHSEQKPSDDSTLPRTFKLGHYNPIAFQGCFFSRKHVLEESMKRNSNLDTNTTPKEMTSEVKFNPLAKQI